MKPKLMLRDLFWLVLVVAMGCAWWINRQQWVAKELQQNEQHSELVTEIIRLSKDRPGVTTREYSTFQYTLPASSQGK